MSVATSRSLPQTRTFRHITTQFDTRNRVLWCIMDPKHRPCFSLELLEDLRALEIGLEELAGTPAEELPLRYFILASRVPGVFNYGGDLELFIRCATTGDAAMMRRYARACVDVLHSYSENFHLPITTISLVQGDALGGGFEAALGGDVIIAERGAQFGFPEVLFNLFPGMGAYNFLSRRIGMGRSERMILGGRTYGAAELHEDGVLDIVTDDGNGENALYSYIEKHSRKQNAFDAVYQVRRRTHPIRHDDMLKISELWVDTALRIGSREIRLMERLLRAQEKTPVRPL